MKYTKEELQNTYGEVQSLEHAEYIAELCESNGIEIFNIYDEGITHFAINRGEIIFTYGEPAVSGHDKKITIPLPPKEIAIEWKEGAVCFDGNEQWFSSIEDGQLISACGSYGAYYDDLIGNDNFQLNTIKQGDCIEASGLDNQKYNDAVEVFELFGWSFPSIAVIDYDELEDGNVVLCDVDFELYQNARDAGNRKRKLTYPQLMAIGELKRLELKGGNAVLSSDEETELKSRAMASELNSQSNNDEWPKVGDEVAHSVCGLCKVMSLADSNGVVAVLNESGFNVLVFNSDLSKPKTPEDLIIEELQAKLVKNNAVDDWMLAANIISGDIEGLTYKSDIESAVKSVINKNLDGDL